MPSKALAYPQQLPVIPVHMLEAVVCCVAPTVPTLPVPLLKCLTFHPPNLMTGCVCVRASSAHEVCMRTCLCACAVHQGLNEVPEGTSMFPMTWPQTKQLLSPPRHPPVILLLTAASRKEHNTETSPFSVSLSPLFSSSLLLCFSAPLLQSPPHGPPRPGEKLLLALSLFVPRE